MTETETIECWERKLFEFYQNMVRCFKVQELHKEGKYDQCDGTERWFLDELILNQRTWEMLDYFLSKRDEVVSYWNRQARSVHFIGECG
jgi:hypothetical protein